jgi:Flp pilus assembly protein TadD
VGPASFEEDAYLRGLAFRQQFTPEGLAAAVANFEEAARIAPDDASAYAALSSAHYFRSC